MVMKINLFKPSKY